MNIPLKKLAPIVLLAGLLPLAAAAEKYEPTWESLSTHEATPEWFRDAKFGIYAHWGLYSVPEFAHEWYPNRMYEISRKKRSGGDSANPDEYATSVVAGVPIIYKKGSSPIRAQRNYTYEYHCAKYGDPKVFGYKDFIPMFMAEKFNADEWADLYQKSGAQFAGPVAEHHDGYSMWDSELTPFCAGKSGPKKDIVGELEKAIKARGMKFLTSFHHARQKIHYPEKLKHDKDYDLSDPQYAKLYGTLPEDEYNAQWENKVNEVVDKYQPDLIWFDSDLGPCMPEKYRQQMAAHYFNKAAEWDKDVMICYKREDLPMSVGTLDHERGAESHVTPYAWLSDDCVSPDTWSYVEGMTFYPVEHVIQGFIDTVSKNGQLLLNITPKPSGEIPEECKHILLEMGEWLRLNGEGIYSTRPWITSGETGGINFTRSKDGKYVYVFTTKWPGETLTVKSLGKNSVLCPWEIAAVSSLATGSPLEFSRDDSALKISTGKREGNYAWGYKVELKDVDLEELTKLSEAELAKNAQFHTYGKKERK